MGRDPVLRIAVGLLRRRTARALKPRKAIADGIGNVVLDRRGQAEADQRLDTLKRSRGEADGDPGPGTYTLTGPFGSTKANGYWRGDDKPTAGNAEVDDQRWCRVDIGHSTATITLT